MASKYPEPPRDFEKSIGAAGYAYLRDLHDAVFGAGVGGLGSLNLDNMGIKPGADGELAVMARADGSLDARRPRVTDLEADDDGIVRVTKGKAVTGPLGAEELSTTEQRRALAFRTNGDGAGVFEEDAGTRVSGAVNLRTRTEHPEPGESQSDLTQYLKDDYWIVQFKRKNEDGADEVIYQYKDMRENGNKSFRTLDPGELPPERSASVSGGTTEVTTGGTSLSFGATSLADVDFAALMVLT